MNGVDLEKTVISERIGHVVKITLNCPEKGNVLSEEMLSSMGILLEDMESDTDIRVLVLAGKNGVFSNGMDFDGLVKTGKNLIIPFIEALVKIRNLSKPVISVIDGNVSAGGMGLMLASDLVIATERSTFGFTEVMFGLIPAIVFPLLCERVSYKKARYLVMSSMKINMFDALNMGLIDESVKHDQLDKELKTVIQKLLFASPEALKRVKTFSDKVSRNDTVRLLYEGGEELGKLLEKKETIEAIKQFMEGGKLPWSVKR
jgi:enoyl-CoA hydratase/carnithine racemase